MDEDLIDRMEWRRTLEEDAPAKDARPPTKSITVPRKLRIIPIA
jgi:hypothetical protein